MAEDHAVLDSIAFNDFTWLARGGLLPSEDMRVIERFPTATRSYPVSGDDRGPRVLAEPGS